VNINNNLKKHRKANECKQTEAAKHLGITVRQYQRLESKTPKSVVQFYKLARLFDTTIDYLLEQENDLSKQ